MEIEQAMMLEGVTLIGLGILIWVFQNQIRTVTRIKAVTVRVPALILFFGGVGRLIMFWLSTQCCGL